MLLAIDPGRDTGWATLSAAGTLLGCGLGAPPTEGVTRVIVERPQIYRGRASKGDPNDLITLAIQVGQYTERYASRGLKVEHVLPHDWKGSVDPEVLCRRVVASLTECERLLLETVLAPLARKPICDELTGGRRHNVIDAVGIAKWSLHRSRAGVFLSSATCTLRVESIMAKRAPKNKAKASPRDILALKAGGSDVRREWAKDWVDLLSKYATPTDLAEELGVTYQTLRRWGRAESADPVPAGAQKLITMLCAAKGVTPPKF